MSVERWDIFELTLHGPEGGNPFLDVDLEVTFSAREHEVRVAGFYDGDGEYRARFMPTETGTWRYRTSSNAHELDGHEGDFACTAPTGANHGPVGVVDGFHFAYADGTPFRPFGTTCYAWIHQGDVLERRTLDTLAASPFNKIRMCVFPKDYRYNENEPEHYPFPVRAAGSSSKIRTFLEQPAESDWSFDTDRFDPAFFQHLETRVRELGALGIEADVILFHPYDRWGFATMSAEEDERYLRYLLARLAPHRNVWWSLANEYDLVTAKPAARWDRILDIVEQSDPYSHLRSNHNWMKFFDHTNPAITHASVQHDDIERVLVWRDRYRKPVVIDECGYEGDIPEAWGSLSARELVHRCWTAIVNGAYLTHGETYLGDTIWWSHGGRLHGESPARFAFLRAVLEDAPPSLEPIMATGPHAMALAGPREDLTRESLTASAEQRRAAFTGGEIPVISMYPGIHRPHEYYLTYFGIRQPAHFLANVPSDETYEAAIIDTWDMTITPLPEPVQRETLVHLPSRPHLALRLRRLP